jgi:hypothetical protein
MRALDARRRREGVKNTIRPGLRTGGGYSINTSPSQSNETVFTARHPDLIHDIKTTRELVLYPISECGWEHEPNIKY